MAGETPEEAVDVFVDRIRSTLDCFLSGTAFGSGYAPGIAHSLTLFTLGQPEPNLARLSTHHSRGELLFRFAHLYTVHPTDERPSSFRVRTSFYQYRVLDCEENEIVVYEWAPAGISPVRAPHMHVPIAGSPILKQRTTSPLADQKTHLGKIHFPTGSITLEDIAELLIREFNVDSQRRDWIEILQKNRERADLE